MTMKNFGIGIPLFLLVLFMSACSASSAAWTKQALLNTGLEVASLGAGTLSSVVPGGPLLVAAGGILGQALVSNSMRSAQQQVQLEQQRHQLERQKTELDQEKKSPDITASQLHPQAEPGEKTYKLTVHASPADSRVQIMNINSVYTPGIALSPGPYHIQVEKSGYETRQQWLTIQDADVVVDVALQPTPAGQKDKTPSVLASPSPGTTEGAESAPAVMGSSRRLALVIGNAAYEAGPLRNPVNDATDMAATLKRMGFKVTLLHDAPRKKMEDAVDTFSHQLRGGDVGFFYFAGHGVQVEDQNYLIPIGARLGEAVDVKYQAMATGWVLERMEAAGNAMNIVVLDACRDNPFKRQWRSLQGGLAAMQAARGVFIAYATEPGGVAEDGTGRNGLYTQHLLHHMTVPGLSIEQVFKNVRVAVVNETQKRQTPWESSSLMGDFYFVGAAPTVQKNAP